MTCVPSLLLAAALALLALVAPGCGKKDEARTGATAPAISQTYIIATDATYAPMQFMGEGNAIEGFEVDVVKAAAAKGGVRVEFKNVPWVGIFAGLDQKRYDAVSSSVSITDERKAAMDFSEPIMDLDEVLLVAMADSADGMADLKGKTIGAQADTVCLKLAQDAKGLKAVKAYAAIDKALEDLARGVIQGVVMASPAATKFLAGQYAGKVRIADVLTSYDIGVAVRKGDAQFLSAFNKGLAAIKSDGTFDKLKAKHQLK